MCDLWKEEGEESALNKAFTRLDATVFHEPYMEDVVPPREKTYLFPLMEGEGRGADE